MHNARHPSPPRLSRGGYCVRDPSALHRGPGRLNPATERALKQQDGDASPEVHWASPSVETSRFQRPMRPDSVVPDPLLCTRWIGNAVLFYNRQLGCTRVSEASSPRTQHSCLLLPFLDKDFPTGGIIYSRSKYLQVRGGAV